MWLFRSPPARTLQHSVALLNNSDTKKAVSGKSNGLFVDQSPHLVAGIYPGKSRISSPYSSRSGEIGSP